MILAVSIFIRTQYPVPLPCYQRYEHTKLQRTASTLSAENDEGEAHCPTNGRLTKERMKRLEDIGFQWKVKNKMKRHFDEQWNDMFEKLRAYKEQFGDCLVPLSYENDPKLGVWVHSQRQLLNRAAYIASQVSNLETSTIGRLPPNVNTAEDAAMDDRRRLLDSIDFCWSTEEGLESMDNATKAQVASWEAMFEKLRAYKEEFGDCLVPKRQGPLGTWVDSQRVKFKRLKKKLAEKGLFYYENHPSVGSEALSVVGRLEEDRIRRLNELGFVWTIRDDWWKRYEELKEYKQKMGHCDVPARYPENKKLGNFVCSQRQQYKALLKNVSGKRPPSCLTPERINLLNEIGFTWAIRARSTPADHLDQVT